MADQIPSGPEINISLHNGRALPFSLQFSAGGGAARPRPHREVASAACEGVRSGADMHAGARAPGAWPSRVCA